MVFLVLAAIVLILFWGFLLGPFRTFFYWGRVRTKQQTRSPHSLICPECGATLIEGPAHAVSHQTCGECQGRWFAIDSLRAAIASNKNSPREWILREESATLPCPKCSGPMRLGTLAGEDFPAYKCEPCACLWLGRVEWISLGFRVLS
ncbi:MAG: zf-TFIIB domain-containing protein [Elusimicrobia bacterium]|nr:zf-TFIIB domain-containing protein [Elusimicrobiota bacterium]